MEDKWINLIKEWEACHLRINAYQNTARPLSPIEQEDYKIAVSQRTHLIACMGVEFPLLFAAYSKLTT